MILDRKTLKFFLLAPLALAIFYRILCWGSTQKTSISEPVRLAYIQFSTAFVNGGHLQGQIRDKLDGFLIKKPSNFSRSRLRRSQYLNPQDTRLYQIENTIVVSYISTQPTILNDYPLFLDICVPGHGEHETLARAHTLVIHRLVHSDFGLVVTFAISEDQKSKAWRSISFLALKNLINRNLGRRAIPFCN